jgi:hypothetical protein
MQVLDQQIVSSWPITEKGTNVFDRPGVGLAPLWVASFAISGIKLRGPAPAQGLEFNDLSPESLSPVV